MHMLGIHTHGQQHYLVIESQFALGHAAEEGTHFQRTYHLRSDHSAIAVDQQIDTLHHIQEHFILLVFDAFTTPRDGICDSHWWFDGYLQQRMPHSEHIMADQALLPLFEH